MRSLLKLAALSLLPLALFSWFFWPTPYAYRMVEHTVVRIHRFTDRVDILRNTGWQAMKPTPPEAPATKYAPGFHHDTLPPCGDSDGSIIIDPRELGKAANPAARK